MKKFKVGLLAVCLMTGMLLSGCGNEKTKEYVYNAPTGIEEAGIFVQPIENLKDDFICGADISTVLAEEESGVVYYDLDGNEADLFKILADGGTNYIRVRVWNDPYDENGNGYGGGNCDATKAAEIGRRAAEYGMKLMVDFHYSDFWADPNKQMAPKAWENMTAEEKAEAAYEYILESMNTILDAGADVGIVQLGNETNNGMAGETKWSAIGPMINAGSKAVKEAGASHGNDDIKIAVHFTNVDDSSQIDSLLRKLDSANVEYDIFGVSYYPFWHGSIENMVNVLKKVNTVYKKDVMVMETSYAYTLEDGDGTGNSVDESDLTKDYTASVQSQANALRDVCAAVASIGEGGLGVFYWEPAWVPVEKYVYGEEGAASILNSNKEKWEKYGSGWASSYASDYDPDDAGLYYGGSAWDNQAWFDASGKALESVNTYRYLKYGASSELKVDFANDIVKNIKPGSSLVMPETAAVHYNDVTKNGEAKISWNEEDLAKVDTETVGEYPVRGTFEDGTEITCTVQVANVNWIENASFEDEGRGEGWTFTYEGDNPVDFQQKESDAYTGEWAMHYWSTKEVVFTAEYTLTGLDDGLYYLSSYVQGGDSGSSASMYMFAKSGDEEYKAAYSVNGWCEWQHPEIKEIQVVDGTVTIGISFNGGTGAWGTIDDFYLCKMD